MMDVLIAIALVILFFSLDEHVVYGIMFLLTAGSGVFLLLMFLFG